MSNEGLAIRQLSAENALLEAENRALRERLRKAEDQLTRIRIALKKAAAKGTPAHENLGTFRRASEGREA